jgi:2-polyprenyl-3-methyl-5-hydroxy-6-metoxy-1,4-benzoquinol methylase
MERINCIICDAQQTKEIFRNYKDKHFSKIEYLRGQPSIIVMCEKCGLVYHNPRLGQKEISLIYPRLYRPERPSLDYLADKLNSFEERAEWLESRLGNKIKDSVPQILDIGCAEGSSLYIFRKRGWKTFGIEPSETFSNFGRKQWNLNILTGFFSDSTFRELKFNIVSLIRVLEHIHNPIELLNIAKNKLSSDGRLFIEVPNLKQPRNNLRKHFFNSTTLYIFTISTLTNLLAKANLEVEDCVLINSGIRVLAKPAPFKKDHVFLRTESPAQIKRIIFKHRIRWFLAAELKLSKLPFKSFFKMLFRLKNRILWGR